MPATFSPASVVRFAIESTCPSGAHVNVYHFVKDGESPFTADDMESLAEDWLNTGPVGALYLAMFPPAFQIQNIRMQNVLGVEREGFEYGSGDNGTRTVSGDPLPGQLSVVASWRTGYVGPRFRGRSYYGVLYEGDQNTGVTNSTYDTIVQTYLNATISNYGLNGSRGYIQVILSDPDHILPSNSTPAGSDIPIAAGITSYNYSNMIYTQRRRRITAGQ